MSVVWAELLQKRIKNQWQRMCAINVSETPNNNNNKENENENENENAKENFTCCLFFFFAFHFAKIFFRFVFFFVRITYLRVHISGGGWRGVSVGLKWACELVAGHTNWKSAINWRRSRKQSLRLKSWWQFIVHTCNWWWCLGPHTHTHAHTRAAICAMCLPKYISLSADQAKK